jgi:membrane protein DedA with SNARE-associated domain
VIPASLPPTPVIVMLESAGIPMPGETILVTAAVYAGTRHALDIRWVIAAAAGGAILGDNIGFWVGREFGEPLLEKWGHLVGLDARKRMLGRHLFARYGGSIVFLGRFVALLRAFAALLAGANGLSPWRFFISNCDRHHPSAPTRTRLVPARAVAVKDGPSSGHRVSGAQRP